MSNRPLQGTKWRHVEKSGEVYQIVLGGLLVKQPDGEWLPGVAYIGPTGQFYVRTAANFAERFEPVAGS